MSQVIERLRVSKDKFEKDEAAKGRQDGRNWAMSRASYEQLATLSELELGGSDCARQLDQALGNSSGNWRDSFWVDLGAARWPSDSYVEAFVDGANDIWNEVADKI